MKRYEIIVKETVFQTYLVDVPDDCDDPEEYFYDMDGAERDGGLADTGSIDWQIVECREYDPEA